MTETLEWVERQVRNARMQDAVETTDQDPYEFWMGTADASLVARAGGAVATAAELSQRILDLQAPQVL